LYILESSKNLQKISNIRKISEAIFSYIFLQLIYGIFFPLIFVYAKLATRPTV